MSEYSFPLDEYGQVAADAQFRILYDAISYGASVTDEERAGKIWARRGEVLPLYPEALRYPDIIQMLIDQKRMEYVKPAPVTPVKAVKPKVGQSVEDKTEQETE